MGVQSREGKEGLQTAERKQEVFQVRGLGEVGMGFERVGGGWGAMNGCRQPLRVGGVPGDWGERHAEGGQPYEG